MKVLLGVIAILLVPALGLYDREFLSRSLLPDAMYQFGGTLQCDVCKMVVKDLQTVLGGKSQEVATYFDYLCTDLPAEYQEECMKIIEEVVPYVYIGIDQLPPEEVCTILTLCGESSEDVNLDFPHYIMRLMSVNRENEMVRFLEETRVNLLHMSMEEDYLCDSCLAVVTCIRDMAINDNGTVAAAAKYLEQYCVYCPYKPQCEAWFQQLPQCYSEFIEQYLDPQTDCDAIGLCHPQTPMTRVEEADRETEPEDESGGVDDEIERIVTKTKYRKKAAFWARRQTKRLRQRSTTYIVGNDIKTIDDDMLVPYDVNDQVFTVPQETKCEICSYLTSAVRGVLVYNNDQVEEGLTELFTDICSALPAQFHEKCTTEVVQNAPGVIIQSLQTYLTPDMLCKQVFPVCPEEEV